MIEDLSGKNLFFYNFIFLSGFFFLVLIFIITFLSFLDFVSLILCKSTNIPLERQENNKYFMKSPWFLNIIPVERLVIHCEATVNQLFRTSFWILEVVFLCYQELTIGFKEELSFGFKELICWAMKVTAVQDIGWSL